jgi:iron complex transport system ATP-binding protein
VQEPRVLLLDEPTTFLDLRHQLEALIVVRDLVVEQKMSAVVAIHDLNLATRFTDEVAVLHQGGVVAAGDAASVLTEKLLGEVYEVESIIEFAAGQRLVVPIAPSPRREMKDAPMVGEVDRE